MAQTGRSQDTPREEEFKKELQRLLWDSDDEKKLMLYDMFYDTGFWAYLIEISKPEDSKGWLAAQKLVKNFFSQLKEDYLSNKINHTGDLEYILNHMFLPEIVEVEDMSNFVAIFLVLIMKIGLEFLMCPTLQIQ